MEINITGLEEVQRILRNLAEKEAPYAVSVAINNTLYPVAIAEKSAIKNVFDRPTPFVVRGVKYKKSTKKDLTAKVFLNELTVPVLEAHVESGQRTAKLYEKVMRSAGILPPGKYTVIASGAKLDRYGNIQKKERDKLMNAVPGLATRGSYDQYFLSTRSGRTARLPMGVWERIGRRIVPILLFVSKATYQERYGFYDVGIDKATEIIGNEMLKAAQRAIDRARR